MSFLSLPLDASKVSNILCLDIIQSIINLLDWRSTLKLSLTCKRLYKLFNERFWKAKRIHNFPSIKLPPRTPIRCNFLNINASYIKVPKNDYTEYLVNLYNYLLFYNLINEDNESSKDMKLIVKYLKKL